MKRSNVMFLVIGASIIFFGCSKEDYPNPESNLDNQETTSLKSAKVKTKFTGICTPTAPPEPGDNAWYDAADDARVTGISVWVIEEVVPIDEITFELTGTAELTVDDGLGKWEMTWHGTQTLTSPDGSSFELIAHAVGKGTGNAVEGLTARWKYSLDFDGTPETLVYTIKGKITEEP